MASLDGVRRHERFGQFLLPAVQSRAQLSWCHAELGTFAEGSILGDEGLRIAEAVAHSASLMYAYWGIGSHSRRRRMLLKINDLCHLAFVNIKPIESMTYAF